jgi:hypothetical protein
MDQMTLSIEESLKRSVRPVYGASEKRTPYHIGSAILLELLGRKVFLTAAHVLDHSDETTIYVGGDNHLVALEGEFLVTKMLNGDRSQDRYDFAFLILSDEQVEAMGNVAYCPEHLISAVEPESAEDWVYTAYGFPNSRNGEVDNVQHRATSSLLSYSSLAVRPQDVIRKLANKHADHLFIRYLNQSTYNDGTRIRTIAARGLSGGALVYTGRLAEHISGHPATPRLAGLVIERVNGTLVATKISVIISQVKAALSSSAQVWQ